jgi:hypothetical protein
MRMQSWDQRRDAAVHLLARLSLIAALAVLGALFVGGAASSEASEPAAVNASGSSQQAMLDKARPVGIALGAVVIGGGIVVLMIGAFRPPTSRERTDYVELVDH